MELALTKTLDEASEVNQMFWSYQALFSTWIVIDGATKTLRSKNDWFYTLIDEKISFKIPWLSRQPDENDGKEFCLTFWMNGEKAQFYDVRCYEDVKRSFLCQKIDSFVDKNCEFF
ncbi:hypothetical protein PVAND_015386 [Polypedilum vanderplanki]|uniref:C-type lectin domain-containing protein n=1 Tax=Polypedilum vanderplanki TaxID=319348 RepID=A0A9J6BCG3_POLVA|nr:hypothetical protein PVAND_015386 [Polypedilum vanderplanki]